MMFYEETFQLSLLNGQEIMKKIFNKIDNKEELPNKNGFYLLKLDKKLISKYSCDKIENKSKENNFVLDCVNEKNSNLKQYDALKDKFLKQFLVSPKVMKNMYKTGLIKKSFMSSITYNRKDIKNQKLNSFSKLNFKLIDTKSLDNIAIEKQVIKQKSTEFDADINNNNS